MSENDANPAAYRGLKAYLESPERQVISDWPEYVHPHTIDDDVDFPVPDSGTHVYVKAEGFDDGINQVLGEVAVRMLEPCILADDRSAGVYRRLDELLLPKNATACSVESVALLDEAHQEFDNGYEFLSYQERIPWLARKLLGEYLSVCSGNNVARSMESLMETAVMIDVYNRLDRGIGEDEWQDNPFVARWWQVSRSRLAFSEPDEVELE